MVHSRTVLRRRLNTFNSELNTWHTEIATLRETGAEVMDVMPAAAPKPL